MNELKSVLQERNRSYSRRLRFDPALEVPYRDYLRSERIYPRTVLFLILALGFGLAPFYETFLFRAPADLVPELRLIQFGLAVPLAVFAALVTVIPLPRLFTQAVQMSAVIGIWLATLLLRHLALRSEMEYPSHMLGVVIAAVAIFAGFGWYRVVSGALLFFVLGAVQEYRWAPPGGLPTLEVYSLSFLILIAVLGSYVNEITHRSAWLNSRHASLLSRTDSLSGLSNRREFNHLFPRLLTQAARDRRSVGVLLMDLDHFKRVNDRYGHLFGDDVIVALGKTVQAVAGQRPFDLCVRYGGEEIVVVWYDVLPGALPAMTEKLLDAIRALRLTVPRSGEIVSITASVGVTWLVPDIAVSPEQVLHHADGLLYQAKDQGRNRAVLAAYSMP